MLKRVYAKIAALRRLKRLVPIDTLLLLYRSFIIPHFEYCNSLLIGIGKTLNKKMEDANYYGLRTVMNTGKTSNYESLLKLLGMRTLEHRRIEQSLIIFFKCFKENGPRYITNLFKPRVTPYNLRSSGPWRLEKTISSIQHESEVFIFLTSKCFSHNSIICHN